MFTRYQRVRLLLLIGSLVSIAVFMSVCGLLGVPAPQGYGVSLLLQPSAILALLGVAFALGVSVLLASFIAGSGRFDAGLICASIGLLSISIRDGSMRTLLQGASGPGVYWALALETALLFAIVFGASLIQDRLEKMGWLRGDVHHDGLDDEQEDLQHNVMATAMQAAVMAVVLIVLAQTDVKKQAIASVAISSFAGTLAAYQVFPLSRSKWFWLGPALVGVVGYVLAYFNSDGWATGDIRGLFAGLARPLPLDYAGAGTAGAILGYWIARSWRVSDQAAVETTPA